MIGLEDHRRHLLAAARLALRGHGRAEPNPLVGCVIVAPAGEVVGWGYHEKCGGPHAEIDALRRARGAARGTTAFITLEPCNHTGRTGPCSRALIEAGVARVVVAREDPHPIAMGGLNALREAGIEACVTDVCPQATAVSDPFVHRVRTGLPWVTVKWAQTLDGRIATRTGESKWISGESSRRLVHRERGRVDVILTGIGTVLKDDPMLTARGVRARRIARRVVVDPQLRTPIDSRLVRTAQGVPTTIACDTARLTGRAEHIAALEAKGVEVLQLQLLNDCETSHRFAATQLPGGGARSGCAQSSSSFVHALFRELVARHDATHVLVEAGPGLMSSIFREGLANEACVFIAGRLLGDDAAPVARGLAVERLADAVRMRLIDHRTRSGDMVLRYRTEPVGVVDDGFQGH